MQEDIGRQIGDDREIQYYKRDFWSKENLKFARIHYRLAKAARIAIRIAAGRDCTLLDVGCGPAALTQVLPANIHYYGIDIAIHEPAENLLEADFLENPIEFGDKKFDIVLAQGVFEYMGEFQSQKFAEIAKLLNTAGTFIVSYVNFGHRNREVYEPYSNVQSFADFRTSLACHFTIDRYFPTSHNWGHAEPNRRLVKSVNMHINANIPFISPVLAVEYFFICSAHGSANAGA
jgi:SAM-dependent methyltransferase